MTRETTALRALLSLALGVLLVGCAGLYLVGLESARTWPELAHLRLPTYLAVVAGLVPVALAVRSVFALLAVVDRGEAFSGDAVALLRRLEVLIVVFAGYCALGLVGFWALSGQMHITLLFAWFAVEVAALFFLATAALLVRLFGAALQLRQDDELTV